MPKQTKKQSRELAQKSEEADADNELIGATAAPPCVSSPACQGGATAAAHSVRTEEEWTELVVALQDMKVANAELKRANAELKRVNAELRQKLRDEMAASLRPRTPQRSHRSTSTGGSPCQEPPLRCPQEGVRPHSIASSAPHQARESNCRVDQYFQVPPKTIRTAETVVEIFQRRVKSFSFRFLLIDNKHCPLAFNLFSIFFKIIGLFSCILLYF